MIIAVTVTLDKDAPLPDGWTREKYREMWRGAIEASLQNQLVVDRLEVRLNPDEFDLDPARHDNRSKRAQAEPPPGH